MTHPHDPPPQNGIIILEDMETPFGRIKIYESKKDGSRTFYQDACFHSRADAKGQSLIAYIHAMHTLIVQAGAKKVAVLGCAGGTLATMLATSGCEVTVVDVNPFAFDLAKRYFCLPDTVRCVEADAREFLETSHGTFDAVALDVFDCGEIPEHLRSVEFFRQVHSLLDGCRVLVANAIIAHDLDLLADHVGASMQEAMGGEVTLYDDMLQPDRNIVICAGGSAHAPLAIGDQPEFIQLEMRAMHPRGVRGQGKVHWDSGDAISWIATD